MHNRISLEIEHAVLLFKGLLIDMLAEVCSHKMGATQVYGSSYTLSSDIIPTIEAQPVPKLRLSKIDKLGRSLMHSLRFSIDAFVSTKNRKKNIGGVYQSRDFYAFVNVPLFSFHV